MSALLYYISLGYYNPYSVSITPIDAAPLREACNRKIEKHEYKLRKVPEKHPWLTTPAAGIYTAKSNEESVTPQFISQENLTRLHLPLQARRVVLYPDEDHWDE